jgi:peptidoglycan/xylan/chitin deacetylase (PgdA/CDA1 family)
MARPDKIAPEGKLIISLDFELHWGVRDHTPLNGPERERLLAARNVIPRLLALFEEFHVHATWATVGFLFARSKDELQSFAPERKPDYLDTRLDPYLEQVGNDEKSDPFHFAPSLITRIRETPGQEIATHSFSHYYCLEQGQDRADFAQDVASAIAIAHESAVELRSFVFPRNQINLEYLTVLEEAGFKTYRAAADSGSTRAMTFRELRRPYRRAIRLLDQYWNLLGNHTYGSPDPEGLAALPATRYLSPFRSGLQCAERMRLRRIASSMKSAAQDGRVFHLWFHPEDFARNSEQNLAFLADILTDFSNLRRQYSMESCSMLEACAAR